MGRKEKYVLSDIPIIVLTAFIIIVTLYPVIYVVSMSFSEPSHVLAKDVYFLPKGFSLRAYRMIMRLYYVLLAIPCGIRLWARLQV